ncbi:MAG: hypothetical protein C0167_02925 [Nitrososphaera sp.]|nr:MAG: hypothetical protein C0167_02925 [Nitrososphaera sp.]
MRLFRRRRDMVVEGWVLPWYCVNGECRKVVKVLIYRREEAYRHRTIAVGSIVCGRYSMWWVCVDLRTGDVIVAEDVAGLAVAIYVDVIKVIERGDEVEVWLKNGAVFKIGPLRRYD